MSTGARLPNAETVSLTSRSTGRKSAANTTPTTVRPEARQRDDVEIREGSEDRDHQTCLERSRTYVEQVPSGQRPFQFFVLGLEVVNLRGQFMVDRRTCLAVERRVEGQNPAARSGSIQSTPCARPEAAAAPECREERDG